MSNHDEQRPGQQETPSSPQESSSSDGLTTPTIQDLSSNTTRHEHGSSSPPPANIAIPSDQATKIPPKNVMNKEIKACPRLDDDEPVQNTNKVKAHTKNSRFRRIEVQDHGRERDVASEPLATNPAAGLGGAGDREPRDWTNAEKRSDTAFGLADEAPPSSIVACPWTNVESIGSELGVEGPININIAGTKNTEESVSRLPREHLLNTNRDRMDVDLSVASLADSKRTEDNVGSEDSIGTEVEDNDKGHQHLATRQSNDSVVDCWENNVQETAAKQSRSVEEFTGGVFEFMYEVLMNGSAELIGCGAAVESDSASYSSRVGRPTCGGSISGAPQDAQQPSSSQVCTATKLDDTPASRVTAALSTKCPDEFSSTPRFGRKPAHKLTSDACDATGAPRADTDGQLAGMVLWEDSDTISAVSLGSAKDICYKTGSGKREPALPPAPLCRRRRWGSLEATIASISSIAQVGALASCLGGGQSLSESSGDSSRATGALVAPGAIEPVSAVTQLSIGRQTKTSDSDCAKDIGPTTTNDPSPSTGRNSRRKVPPAQSRKRQTNQVMRNQTVTGVARKDNTSLSRSSVPSARSSPGGRRASRNPDNQVADGGKTEQSVHEAQTGKRTASRGTKGESTCSDRNEILDADIAEAKITRGAEQQKRFADDLPNVTISEFKRCNESKTSGLDACLMEAESSESRTKESESFDEDQLNVALAESKRIEDIKKQNSLDEALVDASMLERRPRSETPCCNFVSEVAATTQIPRADTTSGVIGSAEPNPIPGMQMLLKAFRTRGSTYELKFVSAMAVAYMLSSSLKSSSQALGNLGFEILECIQFLCTSRATTDGETVTNNEAFRASVSGLATFWIYFLEPMLNADQHQGVSIDEKIYTLGRPRDATKGNEGLAEREEQSRVREALEITVQLVILNAKKGSEISVLKGDPVLTTTYGLVAMVCENESAKPFAARAGVVRILVEWIQSEEQEKVVTAVRSLRSLASISDKYMDIRRAIIQTFSLCGAEPHTRAVAELEESNRNCSNTLGAAADHDNDSPTILGEHREPEFRSSDQSSQEPSTRNFVGSGDNMITALYSAPLVYTDEKGTYQPFPKLDFEMERELMLQCVDEAPRDIVLSFDIATHDRLLATMNKRCTCLHYSGHGLEHYLSFEDGFGGPHWLRVEDIKHLIDREGGPLFKFVFVSACHSGLAGETFASAGIPHVVCCQQEFEIKDISALQFTRQFYHALFVGRTVKESFEQGCRAVRAMPNIRNAAEEMKKFVLLPEKGNHDVSIFSARPVGEWPRLSQKDVGGCQGCYIKFDCGGKGSELSLRNMMQENPGPQPPQFFLGREVITFYVLKSILSKRLVSVVGETGIGRSSLVRFLCHYINKRASTISNIKRICFIRADEGRQLRCRTLLLALSKMLADRGKLRMFEPDAELAKTIYSKLTNAKALIVFDHLEYLEDAGEVTKLHGFLDKLLEETDATVLVTSRRPLGIPSLRGAVEVPFHLDPLNFLNTVKLFTNLCPHLHKPSQRIRLQNALLADGAEAELLPSDPRLSTSTKKLYKFFGGGIPSRVEKAAAEVSQDDFSALVLEIFGLEGSHTSTRASLPL